VAAETAAVEGAEGDSSGLIANPKDTTAQAKPGGTYKDFITADTTTSDPIQSTSFTAKAYVAAFTYPQLVKAKAAKYPDAYDGTTEGDAAESIEFTGDKLQVTFKLRQGMKWDPKAPTNGRAIDAQDVVTSLNRYKAINPVAFDIFYDAEKAPLSPIEKIESPDERTVVFKLKLPDASLLPNLAHYAAHYILPRESEISGPGGFDPKGEVRGYGPGCSRITNRPSAGSGERIRLLLLAAPTPIRLMADHHRVRHPSRSVQGRQHLEQRRRRRMCSAPARHTCHGDPAGRDVPTAGRDT
jgi:hypothetical protein